MKAIQFTNKTAQKIYADYISRIKRTTATLNKTDREEILMELNSHIYEGMMHKTPSSEIESLVDVTEQLGAPEEILKPLIAQKKLEQATRSFNPKHIFKALVLNISSSVVYVFFALLYLTLFGFVFAIIEKIKNPEYVGLFFKNGNFHLLGTRNPANSEELGLTEVLGNWFIPVMILCIIVLYMVITLLLRLKRKK
ncbi:hypothetical protein GCM10011506_03020 [Marivirga lumbricoides]|uniref:DUF1700 domain-containing protein n=1 Tax=Marivirga lumbricoides TaxID=1046115 RepID=A0ABQ1LEK1_9BACT|nr:hypothetical protein GCM10011506_03020 [Marivirga lumbricoides]